MSRTCRRPKSLSAAEATKAASARVVITEALTPRNGPASPTMEASRHDEQEYLETGAHVERPIVTQNPRMLQVFELAKAAASSKVTVLIQGESGTGKEVLARYIHAHSPRSTHPFVAVNCAAIPEGLLESELFGHEKGAFTGAITKQIGMFEWAHHGTILLDEIGEMQLPLQAKLLRVLQEYEIERVGGRKPVPVDIRVIATTNRRLKDHMAAGKFRDDLYYRLNVIPLNIPPLRERKEDIPLLIEHFIRKHSCGGNQRLPRMSQDILQHFLQNDWPGNIRELENMVERWLVLSQGGFLTTSHLILSEGTAPLPLTSLGRPTMSVKEMERALIMATLQAMDGNRTEAAKVLGISLRTLRNKLLRHKLGEC